MRILLIFLFLCSQVSAQDLSFKKTVVIDSLKVSDTLNESFALYLPSQFDGQNPLPILFLFDGEGRGKSAARLFQSSAEAQGYILVSSNDILESKSLEENLLSGVNLVHQIGRVLPIDVEALFFAGSGAGAQVTTSIPLIIEKTAGLIYVGDQLFGFEFLQKSHKFTPVGIAGNQQVNLGNMQVADNNLRLFGYPSSLYIFEGGQEWPSPALVSSAVGSLTLEAIKKKKRPNNNSLVQKLYEQDLLLADQLMAADNYVMARNFLDILMRKYEGLRGTVELKDKLKLLKKSPDFREQEKEFEKVTEKEERLWNDFLYYFNEDVATANFENLGWWNVQKSELKKLTESENKSEAAMAFRLLDLLRELTATKVLELEREGAPLVNKLLANILGTVFNPQNYDLYKNVISLSTMDNDYQTALYYLEEMLKHGYDDLDALYEIEGTLGLKLSREYNVIIKNYLGSSKYFENETRLY